MFIVAFAALRLQILAAAGAKRTVNDCGKRKVNALPAAGRRRSVILISGFV
jgi:hypothetical protein